MTLREWTLLAVSVLPIACTSKPSESVQLTDNALWQPLGEQEDPLASHRPVEGVDCPGTWEEDGLFEVDTDYCNYLARVQPSLEELAAGMEVTVALVHDDLFFDEPAEAHVAVLVESDVLWEDWITIPASSQFHTSLTPIQTDIPRGTPLVFHLHNHGANQWRLLPISARWPQGP